MGEKFNGEEEVRYHDGKPVRVRIYNDAEGKFEKVVLIDGSRNITLEPDFLSIAGQLAQELRVAIAVVSPGFVSNDPYSEMVRLVVLPYTISNESDRAQYGSWKIDAIKKYRIITGAGLKDAKDAVEFMAVYGFDRWLNQIWIPYKDACSFYLATEGRVERVRREVGIR